MVSNAEAKIQTHVIHKINEVNNGSELIDLVSLGANNLDEKIILTSQI